MNIKDTSNISVLALLWKQEKIKEELSIIHRKEIEQKLLELYKNSTSEIPQHVLKIIDRVKQ